MKFCELYVIPQSNTTFLMADVFNRRQTLGLHKLNLTSPELFSNVIGSFDLWCGRWALVWSFQCLWLCSIFSYENIPKIRFPFFKLLIRIRRIGTMVIEISVTKKRKTLVFFQKWDFWFLFQYFAPTWPFNKRRYWSWKISVTFSDPSPPSLCRDFFLVVINSIIIRILGHSPPNN